MTHKKHIFESLSDAQLNQFLEETDLKQPIDENKLFKDVISAADSSNLKPKIRHRTIVALALAFIVLVGFTFYPTLKIVIDNFFGDGASTIIPAQSPHTVTSEQIDLEVVATFQADETTYGIVKVKDNQELALDAYSAENVAHIRNITPATEERDSYFLLQEFYATEKDMVLHHIFKEKEQQEFSFETVLNADILTTETETIYHYLEPTQVLSNKEQALLEEKDFFSLAAIGYIGKNLHIQIREQQYFLPFTMLQFKHSSDLFENQGISLTNKKTGLSLKADSRFSFDTFYASSLTNEVGFTEYVFNDFPIENLANMTINLTGATYREVIAGHWRITTKDSPTLPTKVFASVDDGNSTITLSPFNGRMKLHESLTTSATMTAYLKDDEKLELLKIPEEGIPQTSEYGFEINYLELDEVTSLKINEQLFTLVD